MTSNRTVGDTATKTSESITSLNNSTTNLDELGALFKELKNPFSFWQELRITAMSGTDFLFIPEFVSQAFGPSYPMARFISELSAAFDIEPLRLQIISISNTDQNTWTYGKTILEWAGGSVSNSHMEEIPKSCKFHDYIESMYQHSSSLVDQNAH